MNSFMQRYQLINVGAILLSIIYSIIDEEPFEDIVNLIWIQVVVLYVIIPKFIYTRKYLKAILSILGILILGVLLMEMVIEGDGELDELLEPWTWTHELPGIFWPTLIVSLLKISVDLTIKQHLMVNLEKERLESETKFLQSQLSPHVLFNNLNNIYSFALHKSKQTPELILKLADVMRYMLYETKEPLVPLSKEIEHLDSYIELQQLQLENRGEVIVDKKGNPKGKFIAPMMLISFIENCFKHAASGSIDDLRVVIQIEILAEEINLYTENSYAREEPDEENQLQEGGIGLKNAKRRLELLYPKRHELIIKELNNRYIVNLSIKTIEE